MDRRTTLKEKIMLCGESDGSSFQRTFTVGKKINSGASAVCYKAHYDTSSNGVLKEFYPQDAYGLERNEDGQLVHSEEFGDARERFQKAEQEYLEPYIMLLDAKRNSNSDDLATFIPPFEIYRGCDSSGNIIGSTYIWTPEPQLETFDKLCAEIHKHPSVAPEHKLVTVLSAIESLTKCICALHNAELIHRDIKPSNFGFVKRGGETLTQAISMFDINSICSVYHAQNVGIGTDGFMEPEADYMRANNQTDIYSIGATLFYAIVVTDETKEDDYLYSKKYEDRLRELIKTSKLISASEGNSHPRLRNILVTILDRCLCERSRRYSCCDDLLVDLVRALYYALPTDLAKKQRAGEKWVLVDAERSADRSAENNSFAVLQHLLYTHPLYQCVPRGETNLNVLIIGFGNYGQKFLDICLQVGQMKDKQLNVTVISDDHTDWDELYLKERPGLKDFLHIDGVSDLGKDSYGNLSFQERKLSRTDQRENFELLQSMLSEFDFAQLPHYVFIALSDDALNRSAAKACKDAVDVFEAPCVVSFVQEDGHPDGAEENGEIPVYVRSSIKDLPSYTEIRRMAFNVHLVWNKNLNVDYKAIRADFRKPYNYNSCVANVLSIKYKLYSLGIDFDAPEFTEQSKTGAKAEYCRCTLVAQKYNSKKDKATKDILIWLEHRRWVTEKLCDGWLPMSVTEACEKGMTKDSRNKKHVCLVKSQPNQNLADATSRANSKDIWDKASDRKLNTLDDLDCMSVELHCAFQRKAKELRKHNMLDGGIIAGIRELVASNRNAVIAFQEWFSCMQEIWNGSSDKVYLYEGLKESFLKAASALPKNQFISVSRQVKAFEAMFAPILLSAECRDYKQDDVNLVEKIGFILTYSESFYMIIPYTPGGDGGGNVRDNTKVFSNVAAATVANPAKIIYLHYINNKQELLELRGTLSRIAVYMEKKKLRATVELMIAYVDKGNLPKAMASLEDTLNSETNGRVRRVKLFRINDESEIAGQFAVFLNARKKGKDVFTVEKNRTYLSGLLSGINFYKQFDSYEFNSKYQKFTSRIGDVFQYLPKTASITVTDMVSLSKATGRSVNPSEFSEDYKKLWEKYKASPRTWKALCGHLKEYSEKNDFIVEFESSNERTGNEIEPKSLLYFIPARCRQAVDMVLDMVKKHHIAGEESITVDYTSGTCKVLILDLCNCKRKWDILFSNPYRLMDSDALNVYPKKNNRTDSVVVEFDNLMVSDVDISSGPYTENREDLLSYFEREGYIVHLDRDNSTKRFSFTYTSRQVKHLLTVEGRILEVYIYHKLKESAKFDDVVSSFEVQISNREDDGETIIVENKNEFDCVLTKGFQTIIVECKARRELGQDMYHKIFALTRQFGINSIPVLAAYTEERPNSRDEFNDMQRNRGESYDVVTVWKRKDIENIDETLIKLLNVN